MWQQSNMYRQKKNQEKNEVRESEFSEKNQNRFIIINGKWKAINVWCEYEKCEKPKSSDSFFLKEFQEGVGRVRAKGRLGNLINAKINHDCQLGSLATGESYSLGYKIAHNCRLWVKDTNVATALAEKKLHCKPPLSNEYQIGNTWRTTVVCM